LIKSFFLLQPPAEEGSKKQAFIAIRAWVRGCIESNKLCPLESERPFHPTNNVSAYISGSGDFSGAPNELDRFLFCLSIVIHYGCL